MKKILRIVYKKLQKQKSIKFLSYGAYSVLRKFLSKIIFKKGDFHILHIGQVHSLHFLQLDRKVKTLFLEKNIRQTSTLICTYPAPIAFSLRDYKIFDIFDNYLSYNTDVKKFQEMLCFDGGAFNNLLLRAIKKNINSNRIDLIWIHDLQAGGYPLLLTDVKNHRKLKIICTTYGNDLYHFSDSPKHKEKIQKIIGFVKYFQVESKRDADLLLNLGYKGLIFESVSATFRPYNKIINAKLDQKDIDIIIKGSALLRSSLTDLYFIFKNNASYFKGKKILIFNATREDEFWIGKLQNCGFCDLYSRGPISQSELIELFKRSKFHFTFTFSDGMSNTCVEAFSAKCIPIISRHNSFSELIEGVYTEYNVHSLPLIDKKLINTLDFYEDPENRRQFFNHIEPLVLKYFDENKYSNLVNTLCDDNHDFVSV